MWGVRRPLLIGVLLALPAGRFSICVRLLPLDLCLLSGHGVPFSLQSLLDPPTALLLVLPSAAWVRDPLALVGGDLAFVQASTSALELLGQLCAPSGNCAPLRDQLLALVDEALALPDQALVFQRILIRLRRVVWGAFSVYAPAPTHPRGPNTGHRHRPPRQHVLIRRPWRP
jgi:hypothetical protein